MAERTKSEIRAELKRIAALKPIEAPRLVKEKWRAASVEELNETRAALAQLASIVHDQV